MCNFHPIEYITYDPCAYLFPQKFNAVYPHLSNIGSEAELYDAKETIQQLLRWGWKNNKNVEEQAAQLHMLNAWSQLVEVCLFLLYAVVHLTSFPLGFKHFSFC